MFVRWFQLALSPAYSARSLFSSSLWSSSSFPPQTPELREMLGLTGFPYSAIDALIYQLYWTSTLTFADCHTAAEDGCGRQTVPSPDWPTLFSSMWSHMLKPYILLLLPSSYVLRSWRLWESQMAHTRDCFVVRSIYLMIRCRVFANPCHCHHTATYYIW